MEYITVSDRGYVLFLILSNIENEVAAKIKEGYKPLGGISITGTDPIYGVQVMIKENE